MTETIRPKEYRSYNISFSYQPTGARYKSNKAFTVVCDTAEEAMEWVKLYFLDVEFHNINRTLDPASAHFLKQLPTTPASRAQGRLQWNRRLFRQQAQPAKQLELEGATAN